MKELTQKDIDQAALVGAQKLNLKLRDGSEITVTIRCIKTSEAETFLDAAMEETKALEMVVVEPEDFDPDVLEDESYDQLVEANLSLNFTRAQSIFEKRLQRSEQTGLGIKQVAATAEKFFQKFVPASASSPAKAESKS
ncbi:hypothetical protein [Rubellicoccus peritrichatus]|uniref:Uncharacterized protein n=1 Tax=Rubellicoccus peritrichatus TaxID=3080537 RepID=A0AAQ3LCW2_9BACT|nr:hypothetical protein [Puniceicoccus sp. CR14]WOO43166.1 hypothetical protein RZN69_08675 [Puniceicoccus sp. CR14]